MANAAIETIRAINRCIHDDFQIEPKHSSYTLKDENSSQDLELIIENLSDTVCLIIDKKRTKAPNKTQKSPPSKDPVWPFINPEEEGLTKKIDAILIASRDEALFIFLIEMKDVKNDPGDYLLQMKSGKIFSEFILGLMGTHKKCEASLLPQFLGVLCYGPKKRRVDSQPTKHDSAIEFEERNGLEVCDWYNPILNVKDLLNAAKRHVSMQV